MRFDYLMSCIGKKSKSKNKKQTNTIVLHPGNQKKIKGVEPTYCHSVVYSYPHLPVALYEPASDTDSVLTTFGIGTGDALSLHTNPYLPHDAYIDTTSRYTIPTVRTIDSDGLAYTSKYQNAKHYGQLEEEWIPSGSAGHGQVPSNACTACGAVKGGALAQVSSSYDYNTTYASLPNRDPILAALPSVDQKEDVQLQKKCEPERREALSCNQSDTDDDDRHYEIPSKYRPLPPPPLPQRDSVPVQRYHTTGRAGEHNHQVDYSTYITTGQHKPKTIETRPRHVPDSAHSIDQHIKSTNLRKKAEDIDTPDFSIDELKVHKEPAASNAFSALDTATKTKEKQKVESSSVKTGEPYYEESDNYTGIGGTDGEDDALINKLEVEDSPAPEYEPLPEKLIEIINRLCSEEDIDCATVYQSPTNWKEVQIIGAKATSIQSKLDMEMLDFPNYSILTKDFTNSRHLREFNGINSFSVSRKIAQPVYDPRTNQTKNVWTETEIEATCELILTGKLCNKHYTSTGYFILIPTHFLLDQRYCNRMLDRDNPVSLEHMREQVEGKASKTSCLLELHNSDQVLDTIPLPLFSYRHYQDKDCESSYGVFGNDITLLQLEKQQLQDNNAYEAKRYISMSQIQESMTRKSELLSSFNHQQQVIDEVFPLREASTLIKMAVKRVRIFVGPAKGHMIFGGFPIKSAKRTLAHFIEFVTLNMRLLPGHSGSIVYVQDKSTKRLYPFGMLIGKSLRNHGNGQTVYQAVVLRKCLDEIEACYSHLVSDLRPIDQPTNNYANAEQLIGDLHTMDTIKTQNRPNEPNDRGAVSGGNSMEDSGFESGLQTNNRDSDGYVPLEANNDDCCFDSNNEQDEENVYVH